MDNSKMLPKREGLWKFSFQQGNKTTDLGMYAGNLDELAFQLAGSVPEGVTLDVEAINKACSQNSTKESITIRLKNPEIFITTGIQNYSAEKNPGQIIEELVRTARNAWAGTTGHDDTDCIATIHRDKFAIQEAQRQSARLKLSPEEYQAIYEEAKPTSNFDNWQLDHEHPWSWGKPG